jgi:plastocyanin
MKRISKPGDCARRSLLRRALGVGVVTVFAVSTRRAKAEEVQVTIDNFTFSPTPVNIMVGSSVSWSNQDDTPHSIVIPKLNVKSQALDTDDTFSHRFDDIGTFDYMCGLHPHMRGQVVVI